MKRSHKILIALGLLLAAGLIWLLSGYYVVQLELYPKDAVVLDLRGQSISLKHYDKLRGKLPQAQIRWDVPFRGGILADDTAEVTVTELSMEEAQILADYLPMLETVHGEESDSYEALATLQRLRPETRVNYRIPVNGKYYDSIAVRLNIGGITEEELSLLPYLPKLKSVTVTGGDVPMLEKLRSYCAEENIEFNLYAGGKFLPQRALVATVEGITDEELPLLQLMPLLKKLHLVEPEADAAALVSLSDTLGGVKVSWEKTVLGKTFSNDAVRIDLTDVISLGEGEQPGDKTAYQYGLDLPVQGTQEEEPTAIKISKYHPIPDKTDETKDLIAQVEEAMAYFPEAEKVLLCGATLHNVHMAQFREDHRQEYKVVWSVRCGNVLTRSDATFFMPVKYHVYYLSDAEAYNLRYLEEAVAVDIGHMNVSDISFVEYMPDLEYLILAHTSIQYIEPIRSCKKLKFLEVDWTGIRDLSPLIDCTALEDVNVGNTGVSVEPLTQMPWLKNVWMIFKKSAYIVTQALPDTRVVASGNATVASGWRNLPNYYAMRDALKMYYMTW